MKKIVQLRYYGQNNEKNVPMQETTWERKNLLKDYGNVSHLGIQGEPGVIFYLNNKNNPIELGSTGIYELDLEGIGYITSLYFDIECLREKYPQEINKERHVLLVDFVYNGAEV